MGLAASQARLLMLYARKSDLEFQGQQINQRRVTLSYQQTALANELTQKLNNRTLKVKNSANTTITCGDVQGIQDTLGNSAAIYRTVSTSDPTNPKLELIHDYDSNAADVLASIKTKSDITNCMQSGNWSKISQDVKDILNNSAYMNPDNTTFNTQAATAAYTENHLTPQQIQEGIYDNQLSIRTAVKANGDGYYSGGTVMDWQTNTAFDDELNTTDDALAQAEYNTKVSVIQTQDKELEMELKNVDTEHSSVQTETDAVKKVIDKNVETSFKTFA